MAQAEWTERFPAEGASAGRARRLVGTALSANGHDELVDVAILLTSEVVTNAVLHAGTDVEVRVVVGDIVRVEVHDGSELLPALRHYDADAATGRGLELVAVLSDRWGMAVEPGDDRLGGSRRAGKVVWFELGGSPGSPELPPPGAPDEPSTGEPDSRPTVLVHLVNLPPALVAAMLQVGDAMVRELALLALGGEMETAPRTDWHPPALDMGALLGHLEAAVQAGKTAVDLALPFPVDAHEAALARLALVDDADEMSRVGLLLCPPPVPEIVQCRHWLLGQIATQVQGGPVTAWQLTVPVAPDQPPVGLDPADTAALNELGPSALAADHTNRLRFVGAAAADLLGWPAEELLGQRLTVIVPAELRQAHLAAFGRYQVGGVPTLFGQALLVPALRRDGSRVEVELTLGLLGRGGGHPVMWARIVPRVDAW